VQPADVGKLYRFDGDGLAAARLPGLGARATLAQPHWSASENARDIVSRAFSSLSEMVRLTRHLLAPGGAWYAMKGLLPHAEIDALRESAPDVKVGDVIKLHVPGLNAERSLVLLHVAGA